MKYFVLAMTFVFVIIQIVDWLQTLEITKDKKYWELNPLLGKYPTIKAVNVYMCIAMFFKLAIVLSLPLVYASAWIGFWVGMNGGNVFRNHRIGIRIQY